jgi:hypothetical protein
MRTIIISALAASLMASCATQATFYSEYQKLTKNVCTDNPHEVVLAQHLYNKMKELKYNR